MHQLLTNNQNTQRTIKIYQYKIDTATMKFHRDGFTSIKTADFRVVKTDLDYVARDNCSTSNIKQTVIS